MAERADYARLREGLCPIHGTTLERQETSGWCDECGIGWSMTPEEITVHLRPRDGSIGPKSGGDQ